MINRYNYNYDEDFEQLTESLIYLNEDEPGFFASMWGKITGYFSKIWSKTSDEASKANVSGSDDGIIAKFREGFRSDDAKKALLDRGKATRDSLKMGDGNDSALGAFLNSSINAVEGMIGKNDMIPSLEYFYSYRSCYSYETFL